MRILTAMYIYNKNITILRLDGVDVYIDKYTKIKNFKGDIKDISLLVREKKLLSIDKISYDCNFYDNLDNNVRRVHMVRFSDCVREWGINILMKIKKIFYVRDVKWNIVNKSLSFLSVKHKVNLTFNKNSEIIDSSDKSQLTAYNLFTALNMIFNSGNLSFELNDVEYNENNIVEKCNFSIYEIK